MTLQEAISLLAALGVGALGSSVIGATTQRRQGRGEALKALREVERARWTGYGVVDGTPFHEVHRAFESAALVARLPRHITRSYLAMAQAAYWSSSRDTEGSGPDDYTAGDITPELSEAVHGAAEIMASTIWHPRLEWLRRRRMSAVITQALALPNTSEQEDVMRAWREAGFTRPPK